MLILSSSASHYLNDLIALIFVCVSVSLMGNKLLEVGTQFISASSVLREYLLTDGLSQIEVLIC